MRRKTACMPKKMLTLIVSVWANTTLNKSVSSERKPRQLPLINLPVNIVKKGKLITKKMNKTPFVNLSRDILT